MCRRKERWGMRIVQRGEGEIKRQGKDREMEGKSMEERGLTIG